jgi:hypothetical protein
MNITDKTIETIRQMGYGVMFYDNGINDTTPGKAIEISVYCLDPYYINYSFKTPKNKEITTDWIMNKIAQKENYTSINWNKIFEPLKLDNIHFYITSYGIGVETIFGSKHETRNKINEYLDNLGIEYKNEYSDANWVFRYKISKSKENIEKINKLSNK